MKHLESDLQQSCVKWFEYQYPKLSKLLIAIPNGMHLSGTPLQRAIKMKRAKAEGLKPGTPDLLLAVTSTAYCGLWVEMKTDKGKLSINQNDMIDLLIKQGYKVEVCRSFNEFEKIIVGYLKR